MTPAETLTAAAKALRDGASDVRHDIKTNNYWHGVRPEDAWALGAGEALGGPAGTYTAMFGPDVADAIAEWLDSAAIDAEMIGPDPKAVAAARAIIGEVAE